MKFSKSSTELLEDAVSGICQDFVRLLKVNHLDVLRCWQVEPFHSVGHCGRNISRGLAFSLGSLT